MTGPRRHALTTSERRQSRRAPFKGTLSVQTPQEILFCVARDLSEGGLRCLPPRDNQLRVGVPLLLTFVLPGLPRWLEIQARLVHSGAPRREPCYGLQFVGVPPRVRRILRTYVMAGTAEVRDYVPGAC